MDQTVQDMCQTFGIRTFHQYVIDILKDWHFFILVWMNWVNEGFVFMRNPFSGIGFNKCLIQKLFLLMIHVRNQEREEDMEPLDFGSQSGSIQCRSIQQFIDRIINFSDFHDVNAILAGRRDLDEFSAHVFTGPVKFMPLQWSNDEDLDSFPTHPKCHGLHGEGLASTGASKDTDVGVFILFGIKNVRYDQ